MQNIIPLGKDGKLTGIDLFCGAGGVSQGLMESNVIELKVAINHSPEAIQAHKANNPDIVHLTEDVKDVERIFPHLPTKVNLLWASAECTNYSNAKGGQSRDPDSRSLPEYLPAYIQHCDPDVFLVENVKEFMQWAPLVPKYDEMDNVRKDKKGNIMYWPDPSCRGVLYEKWVRSICKLGYTYSFRLINSADLGAHTSRTRYFGQFIKKGLTPAWPKQTHLKDPTGTQLEKWKACSEILELDKEGTSIFGREFNTDLPSHLRRPLADKTLARIAYGIKKYVLPKIDVDKFIAKNYSKPNNVADVDEPLHSVTTKDRMSMISVEKGQQTDAFITQRIQNSTNASSIEKPLGTVLTRDEKALIHVDQDELFICKQFSAGASGSGGSSDIEEPLHTITTKPSPSLVSVKQDGQFLLYNHNRENAVSGPDKPVNVITATGHISKVDVKSEDLQFVNKKHSGKCNVGSIEDPLHTLTTNESTSLATVKVNDEVGEAIANEKRQFIVRHFGGSMVSNDVSDPLGAVCTVNKDTLITLRTIDGIIKDVKMRYLNSEELARATGFKEGTNLGPNETLRKKHIGNAVPPIVPQKIAESVYSANVAEATTQLMSA